MREFDVVVLGAGAAGEVTAGRLGQHGLSVAIVEQALVGGECSYYACMPSKALLRPGELLAEVRRIPGAREALDNGPDVAAVLRRRDEIIHNLDDSSQLPWLEKRSVTLVRGHAQFDGERRIRVGDETLIAREAVVIATGSGPLMPPIPGLREARPWTNREVTNAKRSPGRLAILGGGVVGAEMAQAWATLGASVTVIEGLPRLLSREEPFAGEQVADALRELGVELRIGTKAQAVERNADGVTVSLDDGSTVTADELLVAIGREPRTRELGLETIGLKPGEPIAVDDRLRSAQHAWLFAIGDVNGRAQLTHMGKYQGRIVADVIDGRDTRAMHDGPDSPRVVFTDPQVAAVGLTLELAHKNGMEARAIDVPTQSTAGASFYGRDAPGTSRLVVDEQRGVIVGATFTGSEVADFMHAATIAIIGEVPLDRLVHAVPAFPTRSEVWLKLLEAYGL
jgi:pyruvate/2-oxoglutarate dehydrogenase complex dihydrolipoamide dehydrogenase (E3) component